jgi:hypothetical protein
MSLMHCREFRDKHVAFVDDLLPIVEMERMRRHLLTCPACARQDTRVRRGLMLVRNLRPIETSPEFMTRLNARIAEMGPVRRDDFVRPRASIGSMASFAALAAGLVAVAYLATETRDYFGAPEPLSVRGTAVAAPAAAFSAPAFAIRQIDDSMDLDAGTFDGGMSFGSAMPIGDAAIVAAVPTGIPVWPAVIMAGQAPMRFTSTALTVDAEPPR